jgi:uncharacterized protein YgiM (DUF1202 family)
MRIRRLTALALATLLALSVPFGLAEELEVYGDEYAGVYEEDDVPADMIIEETDAPLYNEGTATPTPAVAVNTPPPIPAATQESPAPETPPVFTEAESGAPPALLVETPDPEAEPTISPPPTPVPTLPVTADKDMPAPNDQAKAEAIVTEEAGTAMFEFPSHESAIKAQIASGTVLTVKALGLSWTKVDNAGQEGYVPTYTLSFGYGSPQPGLAMVIAKGGKLTLRQKMTTKSKSLGSVPSGRAVVLLAKGKTFSLVRHDAKEGYVLTSHLEEMTADTDLGTLTQVVPAKGKTTANVRLRAKADRKANYYTSIKSGSFVVVKGIENGWAKVEYEGYHGFMMEEYLKPLD